MILVVHGVKYEKPDFVNINSRNHTCICSTEDFQYTVHVLDLLKYVTQIIINVE